jgi:hypothetical protein
MSGITSAPLIVVQPALNSPAMPYACEARACAQGAGLGAGAGRGAGALGWESLTHLRASPEAAPLRGCLVPVAPAAHLRGERAADDLAPEGRHLV